MPHTSFSRTNRVHRGRRQERDDATFGSREPRRNSLPSPCGALLTGNRLTRLPASTLVPAVGGKKREKTEEGHGNKAVPRRLKSIAVVFRPAKEEEHSRPSRFIMRVTRRAIGRQECRPSPGSHQISHFQFRISGMSCPFLVMYCRCSTSLSLRNCFSARPGSPV
jgi:hypothetical protein